MANPKIKPDKLNDPKARVTTFLYGKVKKRFFEDVNRTGEKECHLARRIIIEHYKDKK